MFVPYVPDAPNGERKKSRRAINAFVAMHSAQKRRHLKAPQLGVEFHADWVTESIDDSQHQGPNHSEETEPFKSLQLSMARPLASGKFSPMIESAYLRSQGTFACKALSYFFEFMSPHNSGALGHDSSQGQFYGAVQLFWTTHHESIRQGQIAWALCTLESQGRLNGPRAAILYHRRKCLVEVQQGLSNGVIDDVFISALSLLICIDDYLGHVEYSRAHLAGLDAVVEARGGYDYLGTSIPAMKRDIQVSTLIVRSLLLFHTLNDESPMQEIMFQAQALDTDIQLDLPQGFIDLLRRGQLTRSSMEFLQDFSAWRKKHRGQDPKNAPVWRSPVPLDKLTALEKCIFVGLICLADDTSHMSLHPSAAMYRQAKKRADMVCNMHHVWSDPTLTECLMWLWFVILTPRNAEHTLEAIQSELFTRLLSLNGDLLKFEWVNTQSLLRRFFYDEGRAPAWRTTWLVMQQRACLRR
ncbi:hypothetical protein BJY04DRAFT_202456 [Aspergillus karnatakaensis]|uniref:uncharacterized protein n=1 Tax=Aspergillus karnatakaensis TaxID=1810916 RepID=UPI003CCCE4EE